MVKQFRHWNRFKLVLKEGKENIRCIPHFPQSILYRQVTLHFAFLRVPKHSLNCAHKSLHPWWNIAVSSKRNKGRLVPKGGTRGEDPSSARIKGNLKGPIFCLEAWKVWASSPFCYPSTIIFGLKALVIKTGEVHLLTTLSQQFQRVRNVGSQGRKRSSKGVKRKTQSEGGIGYRTEKLIKM